MLQSPSTRPPPSWLRRAELARPSTPPLFRPLLAGFCFDVVFSFSPPSGLLSARRRPFLYPLWRFPPLLLLVRTPSLHFAASGSWIPVTESSTRSRHRASLNRSMLSGFPRRLARLYAATCTARSVMAARRTPAPRWPRGFLPLPSGSPVVERST